ncbi:hypothetical protein B1757_12885 [Acidithiobacillus marinus]|uniref:Uncharacterized protein n=1 Tax=Acidithiobacillus marinus TaxID=187490 RepID=A0A2I1DIZ0_9PROT|nr:hypothetical protein [Acidithiobacillus marinus]PKY09839.1 hypothetical protein B1757_12885 [Acidithiobacillus marinus]
MNKESYKSHEYWENIKYVVQSENTLGYVLPKQDNMPDMLGVLQGDIRNGGPDRMQGMVLLEPEHLRPATAQDFERFRVQLPSDFKTDVTDQNRK